MNALLLEMCGSKGSWLLSSDEKENCLMADDRSNDAFDTSDLRIGLSQWRAANTEHWGPLISGTQDWVGRSSSTIYTLNKQWLDFLQKRFKEDFALPQRIMSCRTPVELWSAYTGFLQKAVTDYQKEFTELGKLGRLVGSEAVTQKSKKSTSRVDEFRRMQSTPDVKIEHPADPDTVVVPDDRPDAGNGKSSGESGEDDTLIVPEPDTKHPSE
jgi:hypothetical protein